MWKLALPLVAAAFGSTLAGSDQAQAATLLGATLTGCTDSVFSGSVTSDPGACDSGAVGFDTTAVVTDPGIEFAIGGGRQIDFTDTTVSIIYNSFSSSPSDDLFVFTGFLALGGLSGVTLLTANPLGVTFDFTNDRLGLLVTDPECCGTQSVTVTYALEIAAVPLPAAGLLLIGALGGLGLAARRRRA